MLCLLFFESTTTVNTFSQSPPFPVPPPFPAGLSNHKNCPNSLKITAPNGGVLATSKDKCQCNLTHCRHLEVAPTPFFGLGLPKFSPQQTATKLSSGPSSHPNNWTNFKGRQGSNYKGCQGDYHDKDNDDDDDDDEDGHDVGEQVLGMFIGNCPTVQLQDFKMAKDLFNRQCIIIIIIAIIIIMACWQILTLRKFHHDGILSPAYSHHR